MQLAYFEDKMGDVVMALAKETRWHHAVELARQRHGFHLGNGLKHAEPFMGGKWLGNGQEMYGHVRN